MSVVLDALWLANKTFAFYVDICYNTTKYSDRVRCGPWKG